MKLENRLLQEVRGDLPSAYDIFPEADSSSNRNITITQMFRNHGETYVKYIEFTLQIEKIREACHRSISPSMPDPARTWVLRLASYKMGSRRCDELATAYLLKCISKQLPVARIPAQSPNGTANHVFLIYGPEAAHIKESGSVELLVNSLIGKDCKIVDPYLNCTIAPEDFSGSILQQYLNNCGITQLDVIEIAPAVPDGGAQVRQLNQLAASVQQSAIRILDQCSNPKINKLQSSLKILQQLKP